MCRDQPRGKNLGGCATLGFYPWLIPPHSAAKHYTNSLRSCIVTLPNANQNINCQKYGPTIPFIVLELTGHIRKSVLLLGFHTKTDEAVSFAETIFVQNNLGASDVLVARREELVEGKVVDLWGEITHPNGGVGLSWGKARRVVVQLEPHRRIAVWDNFTTETVHHIYGLLVGVKIDEAIACWLASKLVRHYLNR